MTTAQDILTKLQNADEFNVGAATLIFSNPMMSRLLSCWTSVAMLLEPDEDPDEVVPELTPRTHYVKWLWARVEPNPIPLLIGAAGLPWAAHTERLCRVAMDNGLIFPDGTMSKWTENYLKKNVKSYTGLAYEDAPEAEAPRPLSLPPPIPSA